MRAERLAVRSPVNLLVFESLNNGGGLIMKLILNRFRGLGIGVGAFVLFAVVVGIAGAQPGPQGAPGGAPDPQRGALREQFLNTLATNLGVPVDRVRAALEQTREQMRPAFQQQAEGHRGHMREHMGERMGPGMGMGPMMGGAPAIGVAAEILGMDRQALFQELQSGKSLAQIGQEHGMSPDQLTDQIMQRINHMQQQQQQTMRQHIREALDHTWPMGGPGNGPGREGPGRDGRPGSGPRGGGAQ
jgi:hypothetical protein